MRRFRHSNESEGMARSTEINAISFLPADSNTNKPHIATKALIKWTKRMIRERSALSPEGNHNSRKLEKTEINHQTQDTQQRRDQSNAKEYKETH